MNPKTPAEQLALLGVLFKDSIYDAFTKGQRHAKAEFKLGVAGSFLECCENATALWERVVEFMREREREHNKPKDPKK